MLVLYQGNKQMNNVLVLSRYVRQITDAELFLILLFEGDFKLQEKLELSQVR